MYAFIKLLENINAFKMFDQIFFVSFKIVCVFRVYSVTRLKNFPVFSFIKLVHSLQSLCIKKQFLVYELYDFYREGETTRMGWRRCR